MRNETSNPQWRETLCPIDFSERSRRALDIGVALARRDDARLSME